MCCKATCLCTPGRKWDLSAVAPALPVSVAVRETNKECGINFKTGEGYLIHLKRSKSASYLYYDALVDLFYVPTPLTA